MSGTNDSFTFGSSCYSAYDFGELPKGVVFSLAMNPYNGLVVARYNHNPVPVGVVDVLLKQLVFQRAFLEDALDAPVSLRDIADYCNGDLQIEDFEPCPFCGNVPQYDDLHGTVTCCDGRLEFGGFMSRRDAVKSWNDRSAFRVPKKVA